MITSWWPQSYNPLLGTQNEYARPESTLLKISRVSRLLHALCWASLLYTARAQRTEPFPAQFELSSLDGTNGFIINGKVTGEESGRSVSSADINGDGLDDLVIGADEANPLGILEAGVSYVLFGKSDFRSILGNGNSFELSNLNGFNGFALYGEAEKDESGLTVSRAGDMNGDGLAEIVIGARLADPLGRVDAGKSYILFGNRSFSRLLSGGNFLELASLNSTNVLVLYGESQGDLCGISLSSAGDVNGDGLSDLVIGAHLSDSLGRVDVGKSYVVFGSRNYKQFLNNNRFLDLANLNGMMGFIFQGETDSDRSGFSVSNAGDVNGDGLSDLVIGAPFSNILRNRDVGKIYVVFGSRSFNQLVNSNGVFLLSSLNGSNGFIINGEAIGDKFGHSVSNAGDVNGDGLADIVIGAHNASPSGRLKAGISYVVFGSRNIFTGGSFSLASLNGLNGFKIMGEAAGDQSGRSVSGAGDVNGDGFSDILVGAFHANSFGRLQTGKSYVVYGSSNPIMGGTIELSSLNGSNGFIINGEAGGDLFGGSVSSVGDVNGDGLADIVIGANNATPSGRTKAGKTYVIFGRGLSESTTALQTTRLQSTSKVTNTVQSSQSTRMPTQTSGSSDGITIKPSEPVQTSIFLSSTFHNTIPTGKESTRLSEFSTSVQSLTETSAKRVGTSVLDMRSTSIFPPLYAGIAAAVGAFACSLFAGALFCWRKKTTKNVGSDKTTLKNLKSPNTYDSVNESSPMQNAGEEEMQSARYDSMQHITQSHGNYGSVTSSAPYSNYNELPQEQAPYSSDHYTSIDKVEKQHDAYVAAKYARAQENYDELPT